METTHSIAQSALSPAPAADSPPWIEDDALEAAPVAIVARRQVRQAAPVGRSKVEAVHWGVVLLTLATAASVLFGARGAEGAHSRELLPIMITTPAR